MPVDVIERSAARAPTARITTNGLTAIPRNNNETPNRQLRTDEVRSMFVLPVRSLKQPM